VLSRSLLGKLLAAVRSGACKGSKRERTQPGLLVAKCLRDVLGAQPTELDDRHPHSDKVLAAGNSSSSSSSSSTAVAVGGVAGAAAAAAAALESEVSEPRLHVYGPVRLVTGKTDDWWRKYRRNSGASVSKGLGCCSARSISFHYCFGPEQLLLDDVLRRPDAYRRMTDTQRRDAWPTDKQLGGYSYSVRNDANARAELWRFLLDKLTIGQCANTTP
jgi:hypothetical protein